MPGSLPVRRGRGLEHQCATEAELQVAEQFLGIAPPVERSRSSAELQMLQLQTLDDPESICVCMEQSHACGSNNETYTTPCALHEEAMKLRNSSFLKLQHLGPCQSRPWILSPLEDVALGFGQRVALNCEAKGFPVPDIFWEFHSADGSRVIKLPGENHEATVHTSDGPEALMRTSWMQLPRLTKQQTGVYHCIANNSIGETSTVSFVSMS